jgi:hypothetical protein
LNVRFCCHGFSPVHWFLRLVGFLKGEYAPAR